jgi:dephospho-CoA kinase
MPLIYVTGLSGSGKSSIRRALQARGYTAYDIDEDGFKAWYHRQSGHKAAIQPDWKDVDRNLKQIYWKKFERSKVEALAVRAQRETIFLCGTSPNDNEVWDLFDRVIHLSVSSETLRHRLAERTGNDYGKHPDDLKDLLKWNESQDELMQGLGAVVIDAEQPLEVVVGKVLREAN